MSKTKCFSRPGWWQTLCGRDAANQGSGWSSKPGEVGCKDCKSRIHQGEHRRWQKKHILMSMRITKSDWETDRLKKNRESLRRAQATAQWWYSYVTPYGISTLKTVPNRYSR